jgi:hypothetical protein
MPTYFRKSVPQTPVWLRNGSKLVFDTNDRLTGYLATENVYLIGELRQASAHNRGGIVEIDAAEYDKDFVKKKGLVSPRLSPIMEIRPGALPDTTSPRVPEPAAAAAPVADTKPATVLSINLQDENGKATVIPRPRVGRPRKIIQ